jgi:hypothetical protein
MAESGVPNSRGCAFQTFVIDPAVGRENSFCPTYDAVGMRYVRMSMSEVPLWMVVASVAGMLCHQGVERDCE